MSLILDALKKSEAERQRQSGPTLLEVRVTQPRRRYPTWVIAVAVLLAVNMLLLLAFVLRRAGTCGGARCRIRCAGSHRGQRAGRSRGPDGQPAAGRCRAGCGGNAGG